ncbi:fimbria/pilus outer membrane usher protein [Enterobacter kobei]|uniref:fimbria/pilus outer membrane usher protein n=1 Tax=Enterobacter kobei TaxID=208224 RepID=UPI002FD55F4F
MKHFFWLRLPFFIFISFANHVTAEQVEFNSDVLDVNDRKNIDLSNFSREGFVLPGRYELKVKINGNDIGEKDVVFSYKDNDKDDTFACITRDIVNSIGLKKEYNETLTWNENGNCLAYSSLPGMTTKTRLSDAYLVITVPQIYLDYFSDNWDPVSRWDDGESGLITDYNFNIRASESSGERFSDFQSSGFGKIGLNIGSWRLRNDWQSKSERGGNPIESTFNTTRLYAYRAIPEMGSRLTIGDDFLTSDIYDSIEFRGLNVRTDSQMLPPNLRGYAPEIVGIAKTNARVTIKQQGRVVYETLVPQGPFKIQELSDFLTGKLDVEINEEDGSVQKFTVDTASIPYLTRPGQLRYNLSAGVPRNVKEKFDFITGEFSWGVSNGWSLYGGSILSKSYKALTSGIGRDLLVLGALSFDITKSKAMLKESDTGISGESYRLSYSKRFEEISSQVTFAGYRFSEENYMSLSEYLSSLEYGNRYLNNSKELYTVTVSKFFNDIDVSSYINYSHQTYWDKPEQDRYNLSVSKTFDVYKWKNINFSASLYRNAYGSDKDDGAYVSFSVPWGNGATVSYNSSIADNSRSDFVSYLDKLDNNDYIQVTSGRANHNVSNGIYYTKNASAASFRASVNHASGSYTSASLNIQGGATLTNEGAALHKVNVPGSTRIMVDTSGVSGVPIKSMGNVSKSNFLGKAVLADLNSYYRTSTSVDLNNLDDDVDVMDSIVKKTFTDGAIGFTKYDVVKGAKALASIRMPDGKAPPFGSVVYNDKNQRIGLVDGEGDAYLSGLNLDNNYHVSWDSGKCIFKTPKELNHLEIDRLLLPCMPVKTN